MPLYMNGKKVCPIITKRDNSLLKSFIEEPPTDIILPDNIEKISNNFFRGSYVFSLIYSIKANGVKEVGNYSLYGHRGTLKSIIMPNVKKIGNYAFDTSTGSGGDKAKLSQIVLGRLEQIGERAFSGRLNPDGQTVEIDFSFNDCIVGKNAFQFYDLPSFDCSGIKSLGQRTFSNIGKNFKKIWIPSTIETISASSSSYSLFSFNSTGSAITIYTNVADADSTPSGWGAYWNISPVTTSTITTVYNATYEDFLNAEV